MLAKIMSGSFVDGCTRDCSVLSLITHKLERKEKPQKQNKTKGQTHKNKTKQNKRTNTQKLVCYKESACNLNIALTNSKNHDDKWSYWVYF